MGELPQTFFDLTPRLFLAVVDGRARQRELEFERMAWAVHQNAALTLSNPKKFPTLDSFLKPLQPAKPSGQPKTADHLMSVMQAWQAATAGRV
ncbi:hypothetical protein ABC365_02240 [Brevundimonas sp. 3P9-tot-E]|uniref:hypothetical protein n=1 Tax=unclassified Brevundimonas TaxID=2622653 RepID=UPI0039A23759